MHGKIWRSQPEHNGSDCRGESCGHIRKCKNAPRAFRISCAKFSNMLGCGQAEPKASEDDKQINAIVDYAQLAIMRRAHPASQNDRNGNTQHTRCNGSEQCPESAAGEALPHGIVMDPLLERFRQISGKCCHLGVPWASGFGCEKVFSQRGNVTACFTLPGRDREKCLPRVPESRG